MVKSRRARRVPARAYRMLLPNRRRWRISGADWFTWRDGRNLIRRATFAREPGFCIDGASKPAWHLPRRVTEGKGRRRAKGHHEARSSVRGLALAGIGPALSRWRSRRPPPRPFGEDGKLTMCLAAGAPPDGSFPTATAASCSSAPLLRQPEARAAEGRRHDRPEVREGWVFAIIGAAQALSSEGEAGSW